jgi:hypothetical protein
MKRYLLFLFEKHESTGGWHDFEADADSIDELMGLTHAQMSWHVVDTWSQDIIESGFGVPNQASTSNEPDTDIFFCERCGGKTNYNDIYEGLDPYNEDLYGIQTRVRWCKKCHQDAIDDI